MLKKYLLILIATVGMMSTSGCSLFSNDSEETEEAVAEDTESSEDVSESTESSEETVADSSDEEEVVDEYPDDDYGGDESAVATTTTDSESASDSAALPDAPVEGNEEGTLFVGADDSAPADDSASAAADTPPETATSSSDTVIRDSYVPDAPVTISVKKMKKTPYNDGNALINRLYIARDGDTMKSVAEKVYGDSSRSRDLLSWNTHFRNKSLKVGDKVYYSSAKNPNDNSQIQLYYEEAGIAPSYYTAKNGDSIRKVATSLLGHPRSWMEIWATNEVESKWELGEGTQLRYWPAGSVGAPIQAAAPEEMPAAPAPEETGAASSVAANDTGAPADGGEMPADAPADMPAETPAMEEPQMDDGTAMAQTEEAPPPPPPEATAPPPAPAPIDPPAPPAEDGAGGLANMMNGEDDSMLMAVLGGLMFVAALILLVFIRRGRKKVNYG